MKHLSLILILMIVIILSTQVSGTIDTSIIVKPVCTSESRLIETEHNFQIIADTFYDGKIEDFYKDVKEYAKEFDVPPELLLSIITKESTGNPDAYNRNGAGYGLTQMTNRAVISKAAKETSCDESRDLRIPVQTKKTLSNKKYISCQIRMGAAALRDNLEYWKNKNGLEKCSRNVKTITYQGTKLLVDYNRINRAYLNYDEHERATKAYNGWSCGPDYCNTVYVESVYFFVEDWKKILMESETIEKNTTILAIPIKDSWSKDIQLSCTDSCTTQNIECSDSCNIAKNIFK